jgi:peptidoglycan/xylan/chitin deacetylase (PgdA/CDA1 family)
MAVRGLLLGVTVTVAVGGFAAGPAKAQVPVLDRVPTNDRVIFLTLDDGWVLDHRVVDLVRHHNVPVSLFPVRDALLRHPAFFGALTSTGGVIQSHTIDHPHMTRLSEGAQRAHICGPADTYGHLFGVRSTLFRPPYGEWNTATERAASACGMGAILRWSATMDGGRFSVPGGALRPGEVIVLHFNASLYDDLRSLLARAQREGFAIGRLEDYVGGPARPGHCGAPGVGDGAATDAPAVAGAGSWHLRRSLSSGPGEACFLFGDARDRMVTGDWNGDGSRTPGVFRAGVWHLRNSNSTGFADVSFGFGNPSDLPVVGDWNGDGRDDVGVFRYGTWFLRDDSTGQAGAAFAYGDPYDTPVIGDWEGDRVDTPGVVRFGTWHLKHTIAGGVADGAFGYGNPGDTPVVGDWNANGADSPGVVRGGMWHLANGLGTPAEVAFHFGDAGYRPLTWRSGAGPG